MPKKNEKEAIHDSLEKLEAIVRWLDEQDQVDVEEGLKRVKEGAVLVKQLRGRLKDVANDFKAVQKELEEDEMDEVA